MAVPVPEWIVDVALVKTALGPDAGLYSDGDLVSDTWVIPAWNTIVSLCPSVVDVADENEQRQLAVVLANMVASSVVRSSIDGYMSSSRLGESSVTFREGAWEERADSLDDAAMNILGTVCPSGVIVSEEPEIFMLGRGGRALRGRDGRRWF